MLRLRQLVVGPGAGVIAARRVRCWQSRELASALRHITCVAPFSIHAIGQIGAVVRDL